LSRLDAGSWHSRAFAGEPLPSLEALASFMQANGFALNIEIKPTPGLEQATGGRGRGLPRLWQPGSSAPLIFSSFRPEALAGARETAPDVPRALLVDTPVDRAGWTWPAPGLRGRGQQPQADGRGLAGATAHRRPARRSATRSTMWPTRKGCIALGIDGLITDAVDRFSPGRLPADAAFRKAARRLRRPASRLALRLGRLRSSRISGSQATPPAPAAAKPPPKSQRRTQAHVFAQPAAQQRAGAGGQQREPAHGGRHAAQQRPVSWPGAAPGS
jgi:hypothetical protein